MLKAPIVQIQELFRFMYYNDFSTVNGVVGISYEHKNKYLKRMTCCFILKAKHT